MKPQGYCLRAGLLLGLFSRVSWSILFFGNNVDAFELNTPHPPHRHSSKIQLRPTITNANCRLLSTRTLMSSFRASPLVMTSTSNSSNNDVIINKKKDSWFQRIGRNLPIQRRYEKVFFSVYFLLGSYLTRAYGELPIMLVWLSFVLAISFMESRVKAKAPLLRPHVAPDISRHVFAALQSVEWGLASAFWLSVPLKTHAPGKQRIFAGMATACVAFSSLVVAPKLYFRAKRLMVKEANRDDATEKELEALEQMAADIEGKTVPHPKWHLTFILLEVIKAVFLGLFLATSKIKQ